jgi:hypothetical protein
MPGQNAEIIDLKAYRERRSAATGARHSSQSTPQSIAGPISPATFVMPTAFYFFWPTWVFSPAFPIDSAANGHGWT